MDTVDAGDVETVGLLQEMATAYRTELERLGGGAVSGGHRHTKRTHRSRWRCGRVGRCHAICHRGGNCHE